MRVSRRIRPSQVGCAASASRRRLQAASLTVSPDTSQPRLLPNPSIVIQPDGQILPVADLIESTGARPAYDEAEPRAVASARG
jgi:hypothetical protein